MNSFSEFLHMGGYAAFVWPSYAIVTVVLVTLLIASIRFRRANEAELTALEAELNSATETPAPDEGTKP